jgi:hypothetical protein
LTGFDIAAQVLGIAHVNLYMAVLSQLTRSRAMDVDDLRLYATDALDREGTSRLQQLLPLVSDEGNRLFLEKQVALSTNAKRQANYRLVIGNPPYRNNSRLTLSQVAARFPRLLQKSAKHGGAQRRNIRDDYAWFVAAADFYVEDEGVICFILSDSFASHRAYEHFRAELLRHYSIRLLVRLGNGIFADVGYRTAFAIVLLEKRPVPLNDVPEKEAIPYYDLSPLAEGTPQKELGTADDPRLSFLRSVASGGSRLRITTKHVPAAEIRFSLYPTKGIENKFAGGSVPVYEKGKTAKRLFVKKWPGIITAFDALFKGETRGELEDRISSLFRLCQAEELTEEKFGARLEDWARQRGFEGDDLERLQHIAGEIRGSRGTNLLFDPARVKRSFSGAIPDTARWYPPKEFAHYLYYEDRLSLPRKTHPGKPKGWGTMSQWREAASHLIAPKLIFTTACHASNGYAAFVVEDEWYVKLHGGTSQQFNYVGLNYSARLPRFDGLPNNLTDDGIELHQLFVETMGSGVGMLHYVAGVWNSGLSARLLSASSSARPLIRIPRSPDERDLAVKIAKCAQRARDVTRAIQLIAPGQQELDATALDPWLDQSLFGEQGFQRVTRRSKRFRSADVYLVPQDACDKLREYLASLDANVNDLVEQLYP